MRLPLSKQALCFVLAGTVFCGWARTPAQETTTENEGVELSSDFELKMELGKCQIRQSGSQEWRRCSTVNEPVAVGLIDRTQRIYVCTKAVKPPKVVHQKEPIYPTSKLSSGENGGVTLSVVVDDHGKVRLAKVRTTSGPEFSKEAVEAVTRWTFKPAKLDGDPVAALISVEIAFLPPRPKD